MLPGYLSSPITQSCFTWEGWELLGKPGRVWFPTSGRTFIHQSWAACASFSRILGDGLHWDLSWPQGSPWSHFSGLTGWWVPEEGGTRGAELSLGCERDWQMLEMPAEGKKTFPRIQRQLHWVSSTLWKLRAGWDGEKGSGSRDDCQPVHVFSSGKICRISHRQWKKYGNTRFNMCSLFLSPCCSALFPPHTIQSIHCTTNQPEISAFSVQVVNQVILLSHWDWNP